MKLSGRDIVDILKTLHRLGYRRFYLEHGDLKLEVDSDAPGAADGGREIGTRAAAQPAEPEAEAAQEPAPPPSQPAPPPRDGLVAVTAPMTGTFYRAPAPDAAPFVEVGTEVRADQTVCIVEVMKLFNSIAAGRAGTVVEICAENEARVDTGEALIWIEPKD